MKKIVGIVSVLALASALFADAPAFNAAVTKYTGEASLSYKVDLDADNGPAMGMANAASATVEIGVWSAGSAANSGDGLWGELAIGGDASSAFGVPSATVKTAKIHFVDGDFSAAMNILNPGEELTVGGGDMGRAVASAYTLPKQSVKLTGAQGFTLETALKDVGSLNVAFVDNGVKISDEKKFAVKADATITAIAGLDLAGGVAWSQEEDKVAMAARAGYKVDIDDGLYVKPSVGYAMKDKAKELGAQVLLAWGAEGAEPGFAKFKKDGVDKDGKPVVLDVDTINNKCTPGVSVTATSADLKDFFILVGAFDNTFVPGLTAGAQFGMSTVKDSGFAADVAAKYSTTIDIFSINANAGAKIVNAAKETKMGFLYGAGVSTTGIIQNTTLSVDYAGQTAKDLGYKDIKGTITMSAKISL